MCIDSGKQIHVTFDPDTVLTSIESWRNAVDMKMPLRDDFKIHFMQNRRQLLNGFERTANAMSILLRGMAATDAASATELASVREKLDEFVQWTKGRVEAIG
jgi:hypothetical protein